MPIYAATVFHILVRVIPSLGPVSEPPLYNSAIFPCGKQAFVVSLELEAANG